MNTYLIHFYDDRDVLHSTYAEGLSEADAKEKFLLSVNEEYIDIQEIEITSKSYVGV